MFLLRTSTAIKPGVGDSRSIVLIGNNSFARAAHIILRRSASTSILADLLHRNWPQQLRLEEPAPKDCQDDRRQRGQVSGGQSLVEIPEQVFVTAWLAQEANRTGLHGAHPQFFFGMACDENNGDAMTAGDQPVLQIQAAQPRHLHIGDEARCVVDLLGVEKCLRGAKRRSAVPKIARALLAPHARLHRHRQSQSSIRLRVCLRVAN